MKRLFLVTILAQSCTEVPAPTDLPTTPHPSVFPTNTKTPSPTPKETPVSRKTPTETSPTTTQAPIRLSVIGEPRVGKTMQITLDGLSSFELPTLWLDGSMVSKMKWNAGRHVAWITVNDAYTARFEARRGTTDHLAEMKVEVKP